MSATNRATVLTIALLILGGAFSLAGSFLNPLTLLLLAAAVGSYIFIYTLWLKPRSPWSVFAGAVPGALPPLIGAAAVSGSVSALTLLLGLVIFIWQLPHSWFLALHYGEEYREAGIPTLPATHGTRLTKRLALLSSAALLPATLSFSLQGYRSPLFTFAILLGGIIFLLSCHRYLFRTFEYRKGFIASIAYLATIFAAIVFDIIMR
jgi:protoheme IX farnesyltransferase